MRIRWSGTDAAEHCSVAKWETLCRVFLYKFEFSFLNGILMVSPGPSSYLQRYKDRLEWRDRADIFDGSKI